MAPSRKLPSGATTDDTSWRYHAPGHDVAECVQNVTGQLPSEFADWPTHIQDELFLAVELLARVSGKPFTLYHAICAHDIDTGWYVRAIAVAPTGKPVLELLANRTQH